MGPSRVSVVVNSCNRAESLAALLAALRHQTYEEFEVVVVRGPCTDGTDEVLAAAGPRLTVVPCPERNLSVSRNLGIRHSAGELVAFVDDDAVPTAGWLEALVEELGDDAVVGAGGVVLDADGFATQYRYSACDGLGRTRFDVEPPLAGLLEPDADLRLYLQGTNQCYRREALVAIGGFDEDLRYGYDEVDLCRRLVGAGGGLAAVDGAPVVHRYLANACRDARGRFLEPFEPVRSRAIFAARHAAPRHRPEDVTAMLAGYRADLADWIGVLRAEGEVDGPRAAAFLADVDRGLEEGLAVGAGPRPPADLEPTEREFLPYAGDRPPSYARICLVSRELPGRGTHGGIARYTADLADAFVAAGHEVHVVTGADDRSEVRFEEGRWLHRLAHNPRRELQGFPVSGPLENALAVWHEVRRILAWGPLHVVSAPIWDCEGLVCGLDPGIPLMTTLVTSFATVAAVHPSWAERPHTRAMIELEARTLQAPGRVHALSAAVLEDARSRGLAAADVRVVPLGVRSPGPAISPARDGTTILFVGRLERRKGVDVLLRAFAAVHRACPEARLVLAGDHTENTELAGRTYEQEFHAGADEDLRAAVEFAGPVSQERLHALYASADVVCAPSRYESFGLVAVEAMACGTPVVASRVGGLAITVKDGETGYLVPARDTAAFADRVGRLLASPELVARLGAGAAAAGRTYSWRAVADRILGIYAQLGPHCRRPEPAPQPTRAYATACGCSA
jgi:glycosyltransferase involved in cell wall biosynthesis/GT2 family glycosyltransferase